MGSFPCSSLRRLRSLCVVGELVVGEGGPAPCRLPRLAPLLSGVRDVMIQDAVAAHPGCRRPSDERRARRPRHSRTAILTMARPPAPAGDHRPGGGPVRRGRDAVRLGHRRVVQARLEHHHHDLARLPGGRGGADHACRPPPPPMPGIRSCALPPTGRPGVRWLEITGLLRGGRGAQQRTAGQPGFGRHDRHVHVDHRGGHLRRGAGGLRGAEDLLHVDRRSPVPTSTCSSPSKAPSASSSASSKNIPRPTVILLVGTVVLPSSCSPGLPPPPLGTLVG